MARRGYSSQRSRKLEARGRRENCLLLFAAGGAGTRVLSGNDKAVSVETCSGHCALFECGRGTHKQHHQHPFEQRSVALQIVLLLRLSYMRVCERKPSPSPAFCPPSSSSAPIKTKRAAQNYRTPHTHTLKPLSTTSPSPNSTTSRTPTPHRPALSACLPWTLSSSSCP